MGCSDDHIRADRIGRYRVAASSQLAATKLWVLNALAVLSVCVFLIVSVTARSQTPPESPTPAEVDEVAEELVAEETEQDEYGDGSIEEPVKTASAGKITRDVRYLLEGIEVRGNKRTGSQVVRQFIPLRKGDVLDPASDEIEAIEFRLMGTGWFRRVHLSLKRGSQRGWVVLVVTVKERRTFVIEQVALGLSDGVSNSSDRSGELQPYLGGSVAETNLFGQGIRVSGAFLVSQRQQGVRIGLIDPYRLGRRYALRTGVFFNNAREYFGNNPLVSVPCNGASLHRSH